MAYNPFERPLRNLLATMVLLPLVVAGLMLMPVQERDYLMSFWYSMPHAGLLLVVFLSVYSYPLWLALPLLKRVSGKGLVHDALEDAESVVLVPLIFADGFFRLYRLSRSLVRGEGEGTRRLFSYLVAIVLFASLELQVLPQAVLLIFMLSLLCWLLSLRMREKNPLEEIKMRPPKKE